ncbi:hypothetical protein [Bradyrhizobium sp.]|jgi:hypothetical protein|uniref:hypothetical protein n=1 Tax=Bradyrhizobium sp. TaxID=376 RepID=UPI002E031815|nr:hypothetical protein [Bradyrhizobium sp.]
MTQPEPIIAASEAIRFPRLYAAIKWTIIGSLILLGILAAAFWTLVLGGFAASGFRASNPAAGAGESLVITPECAWPLDVNEHDAKAVCRMFYNLTAEQRAQVLARRK